ncbi:RNA 2'-phosphotransferase [Thermodesulfobacteriota bacterium]
MTKKNRIKVRNLSRFMTYILGHNPDEFGLVPDRDGFITFKELLWALHEEPDWSYVRQSSINEVLLSEDRVSFEVKDKSIRSLAGNRQFNIGHPVEDIPPVIYIPVRRKAHHTVFEKGLPWSDDKPYVFSMHRDMAERIGKRRDSKPVILEVMSAKAMKEGIQFYSFGKLFLSMELPSRYIAGPPAPKDTSRQREEKAPKKQEVITSFDAGTFVLDSTRDPDRKRGAKGKKKKGWKEESRARRRKGRG